MRPGDERGYLPSRPLKRGEQGRVELSQILYFCAVLLVEKTKTKTRAPRERETRRVRKEKRERRSKRETGAISDDQEVSEPLFRPPVNTHPVWGLGPPKKVYKVYELIRK